MLVVDDSVVIRRLVTHALNEDPQIEVVGSAADGSLALQRIAQYQPDVITLDIEMPVMDGLETLRRIRSSHPSIRVIMFSTLTERGASATVDALSLGANDYVTKAANAGSLDRSMANLRSELVPKIKQFFDLGEKSVVATPTRQAPRIPAFRVGNAPRRAVVVGVSTGGPNALAAILPLFPEAFPLPVLIVQHMPAIFTRLLAERLNTLTPLGVEEASDGALVEPGKVLIAPGDYHMELRATGSGAVIAALNQNPHENSCRPSVDVLFRSAAEIYGASCIAVMLTGMGADGARGAALLHERGAHIIAQDEASSVVWGMPGAVVNAGLADSVAALPCIVPEILKQI